MVAIDSDITIPRTYFVSSPLEIGPVQSSVLMELRRSVAGVGHDNYFLLLSIAV